MKKITFILMALILTLAVGAQGNSGKAKSKQKNKSNTSQTDNPGKSKEKNDKEKADKEKADKVKKDEEHDRKVWDGVGDNNSGCMKPSKNQPAKVRSSFQRDYPNATNVRWTKCRGDWTATFGNGVFSSTAVYHANGERRDTRTPVTRNEIPRRVSDEIFKRRPDTRLDDAIKIEVPNAVKDIFRIKSVVDGRTEFIYIDTDGSVVNYNY